LSVFRSRKHIYAQVIDDTRGVTLASASSLDNLVKDQEGAPAEDSTVPDTGKVQVAFRVGKLVAQRAVEKGVSKAVFDRNGFLYHGRVAALSEGARKGGLQF
jgi:large subunit ribosomal protein L18